jgi:hypothetical protein
LDAGDRPSPSQNVRATDTGVFAAVAIRYSWPDMPVGSGIVSVVPAGTGYPVVGDTLASVPS